MPFIRYGMNYGINLDQCEEWVYEEKPPAARGAKAPPVATTDDGLVSTLRLTMRSGREIVYEGEQAQNMRRFLQSVYPSV